MKYLLPTPILQLPNYLPQRQPRIPAYVSHQRHSGHTHTIDNFLGFLATLTQIGYTLFGLAFLNNTVS